VVEAAGKPCAVFGADIDGHIGEITGLVRFRVEQKIVAHKDVQKAVPVIVKEQAARATWWTRGGGSNRFLGDIREGAVSVVWYNRCPGNR